MDSIKIIKTIGIYFLVAITAINIYFMVKQKHAAEAISHVEKVNLELKNANEMLKEKVKLFSPTESEKQYQTMMDNAKLFIHSAYIQQKEGYSERRMAAKNIMSNELWERFFPADTTYQDQIKTSISNDQYFVQEFEPGQTSMDVMVKFEHELDYLQTGNVDKSGICVIVSFEKMNGKWVAVNIQDINAVTKNITK